MKHGSVPPRKERLHEAIILLIIGLGVAGGLVKMLYF